MLVKDKKLLATGKHAIIYTAMLGTKKIAIKQQRKDTKSMNIAQKEAYWLRKTNKKGIGPKLLFYEGNYVVYEFVDGEYLPLWTEKHSKEEILKIINKILKQCYTLDRLGITKEEMHNPYKHILIKNEPVLIDFERARKSLKPQNLTQFCQYITTGGYKAILKKKKIIFDPQKTRKLAKEYKKNFKRKISTKDLL
ncbi:MAG: hypothetical protein AABW49_01620 [Nanoarchaeota archaeon]